MEISVNTVFEKIREISAEYMEPRPYINVSTLEQELQTGISILAPYLVHLKKKRLIIFNRKHMTAIKLTQIGFFWTNE